MLTKTQVIESFKDLPEKVSADDLIERILLLQRIERGLQNAENGRVSPHDQVMNDFWQWRKQQ